MDDTLNDTVAVLPVPAAQRWSPARAGIVNLWRYWDETFIFHRGRLLLRGPNGSGKSMALELLLPFLLDADANPARLTSAAKPRGTLFDRVMTGGADTRRVGFAWVEFCRGAETFTVGVRLSASASTRKVDHDFFTTSLVVGRDLHLLDEQRTPLSRRALVDALGDRGRVHGSADEHRAAVREVLYAGFSADRHGSVIGALLALRKEKVSQNLDLTKLSGVLSDALPPLDDHDLATVAEGFERLDRRRAELQGLEAELDVVRGLAASQRHYARVVVARAAGDVRAAKTRRDDVTRAERAARGDLTGAEDQARQTADDLEALTSRLREIDAEVDALKDSEAYRAGGNLRDLKNHVTSLRERAVRDRATAEQRDHEREQRADELAEAEHERSVARDNARLADGELRRCALPLGAEALADEVTASDPDDGERLARGWARGRRELVARVRAAIEAHARAVERRAFDEQRLTDDQALVERRVGEHEQAEAGLAGALETYVDAVQGWTRSCTAVAPERIGGALPPTLDDPTAVRDAVRRLAGEIRAELAVRRSDLRRAIDDVEGDLAAARDEKATLEAGELIEPDPPAWRSDRSSRHGAPVWRLVDRRPEVADTQLDGIEAALRASGLLDAWVAPDGRVDLPADAADLVLTPLVRAGATLADVLTPLGGAAVPRDVVERVLASIALDDTVIEAGDDVRAGRDGSFRLGPAVGRGTVQPAELLGAEAQERRRLARIAELDRLIASLDGRVVELRRAVEAVDAQERAALADLDAIPDGRPVDEARDHLKAAETRLADAEARRDQSRAALDAAEDAVRQALRALTAVAAQHQLPTTADGLDEVAEGVAELQRAAETWARRARELAGCERRSGRARTEAERAEAAASQAAEHLADSEREAEAASVRLGTLEQTVAAPYRQVLDRLTALDDQRRDHARRQRTLTKQQLELTERTGQLKQTLIEATRARGRAEQERDETHRRFVALATDGLAADAQLELPDRIDGVTAVLEAAQAAAAGLEKVSNDDGALERADARVQERLHHARGALSGRVDLDRELTDDGWWLLRAGTDGIRRSVAELGDALTAQLQAGRDELAADEERLFEQTLAGSVRRALADRIRHARGLVGAINTQLDAVKSAAGGVQVRLRWEVDPEQPDAVRSARALLLRDPADLSDEERVSLQEFVRSRVDQARAELEVNASWEARLRETLDYRSWHRFTLHLAHRDWDGFQPATAKRMQKLSTGERSIALHLPMLASIAAHYADEDGQPSGCPRLILLDELFAGVDAANRLQLFGTFTAWDLDAVFTSDHEWCQYASLDGIAIHHLHPAVGDEPVTSTRFTWDGRRRRIDDGEAA